MVPYSLPWARLVWEFLGQLFHHVVVVTEELALVKSDAGCLDSKTDPAVPRYLYEFLLGRGLFGEAQSQSSHVLVILPLRQDSFIDKLVLVNPTLAFGEASNCQPR